MILSVGIIASCVLFVLWHEPWFTRRLQPGEAVTLLGGKYDDLSPAERERFQAFMDADDGRPFYMVNLMAYRERADYRPGTAFPPEIFGSNASIDACDQIKRCRRPNAAGLSFA